MRISRAVLILFLTYCFFSCSESSKIDADNPEVFIDDASFEAEKHESDEEIQEDKPCTEGETSELSCGINGNGTETHKCQEGDWVSIDVCVDDDECKNDETRSVICGENDRGLQEQKCIRGFWRDNEDCVDPDECMDGEIRKVVCGEFNEGTDDEICKNGSWELANKCTPLICTVKFADDDYGIVKFSPDSSYLVHTVNTTATVYETETWTSTGSFEIPDRTFDIDINTDGSLVAFSTKSGLYIYNSAGVLKKQMSGLPVVSSSFFPLSNKSIASVRCMNNGFEVFEYDINTGNIERTYTDILHTYYSTGVFVEVSRKGNYLAYAFEYISIGGLSSYSHSYITDSINYSFAFSDSGEKSFSIGNGQEYIITKSSDGKTYSEIETSHYFNEYPAALIFTEDENYAFAAWTDGTVDYIDIENSLIAGSVKAEIYSAVKSADFSKNMEWVAFASLYGVEVFYITGERIK